MALKNIRPVNIALFSFHYCCLVVCSPVTVVRSLLLSLSFSQLSSSSMGSTGSSPGRPEDLNRPPRPRTRTRTISVTTDDVDDDEIDYLAVITPSKAFKDLATDLESVHSRASDANSVASGSSGEHARLRGRSGPESSSIPARVLAKHPSGDRHGFMGAPDYVSRAKSDKDMAEAIAHGRDEYEEEVGSSSMGWRSHDVSV